MKKMIWLTATLSLAASMIYGSEQRKKDDGRETKRQLEIKSGAENKKQEELVKLTGTVKDEDKFLEDLRKKVGDDAFRKVLANAIAKEHAYVINNLESLLPAVRNNMESVNKFMRASSAGGSGNSYSLNMVHSSKKKLQGNLYVARLVKREEFNTFSDAMPHLRSPISLLYKMSDDDVGLVYYPDGRRKIYISPNQVKTLTKYSLADLQFIVSLPSKRKGYVLSNTEYAHFNNLSYAMQDNLRANYPHVEFDVVLGIDERLERFTKWAFTRLASLFCYRKK